MNFTGLNENYTKEMRKKLNAYLSSVQITYMNVRGYHWNITGKQFFALHEKFEEIYNSLNEMADEIAERILMLGGEPLHSFSEYIKISTVNEKLNISTADETVRELLSDIGQLVALEREIISLAADNEDEGTASLMSDYIGEQEKMIWMFNAYLK